MRSSSRRPASEPRERLVGEVGQRRAPPQLEGGVELGQRRRRPACSQLGECHTRGGLEAGGVVGVVVDDELVARRP